MKNLIPLILLTSLLLLAAACKKEKKEQQIPASLRENFSCYVDGEYMEVSQTPGIGCTDLYTSYYPEGHENLPNSHGYLVVRGTDCEGTRNAVGIVLDSVLEAGIFNLPEDDYNCYFFDKDAAYRDTLPQKVYQYDHAVGGFVDISELTKPTKEDAVYPDGTPYVDVTAGWIEGRFEMQLMNAVGDTIKITQGKFGAILR